MAWHRRGWAGWVLRLAGALLLGAAALAGRRLFASTDLQPFAPGATDWLFGALVFGCGTSGLSALVLGQHLFDPIAVSSPWLHTRGAPKRRAAPPYPTAEPSATGR